MTNCIEFRQHPALRSVSLRPRGLRHCVRMAEDARSGFVRELPLTTPTRLSSRWRSLCRSIPFRELRWLTSERSGNFTFGIGSFLTPWTGTALPALRVELTPYAPTSQE